MIKTGIEVLSMYLILFTPLVLFFALGQLGYFLAYGITVTAGSFFSCLIGTIKGDIAARRIESKQKRGKRA